MKTISNHLFLYIGMISLHISAYYIKPIDRYPDLYPVLFSLFSAGNFCAVYCYFVYKLVVGWDDSSADSETEIVHEKIE